MKHDGRLRRNWLKGALGDALHAMLCGAGHNLRMILRAIRLFYGHCFASHLQLLIVVIQQQFLAAQFKPLEAA
jgi:IS5 family transposase